MPIPMPPVWKPIGGLKPLETEAPMEPTMGVEEGKAEMVEPCTGAGRAVLANDRLFSDVMLLRRLLPIAASPPESETSRAVQRKRERERETVNRLCYMLNKQSDQEHVGKHKGNHVRVDELRDPPAHARTPAGNMSSNLKLSCHRIAHDSTGDICCHLSDSAFQLVQHGLHVQAASARGADDRPPPRTGLETDIAAIIQGAGKMLEENHRVMFFKLFEQPPLLLDRHALAGGNVMKKLFESLQGGSLALVLVLLWCHLLAEGECCKTEWRRRQASGWAAVAMRASSLRSSSLTLVSSNRKHN
ncbi:hypothetical protein INR49_012274 [Caranx melampygus]|nr:hypothetical protein INR49_012274 [Caranx melampygus]